MVKENITLEVSFDFQGFVHYRFTPEGKIVNNEMYINILRRLRVAVRRKPFEKRRTNIWFLFHDNVPAHRSFVVKDFLVKYNVTTVDHLPCSPDLASTNFYLFTGLKLILKERRLYYAADIIKNVMKELKRLSQNGFQECVQHLYTRWQKSIVAQKDHLKEIYLKLLNCFLFIRNKFIPRTF